MKVKKFSFIWSYGNDSSKCGICNKFTNSGQLCYDIQIYSGRKVKVHRKCLKEEVSGYK